MTIKGGDRFDHPSCPPPPLTLSVRSLSGGRWDPPGVGQIEDTGESWGSGSNH